MLVEQTGKIKDKPGKKNQHVKQILAIIFLIWYMQHKVEQ